jgi:SAM-dependent methyltransferase
MDSVETYSYVGKELELFQHATHWKTYYARALRPFIAGDVLEVGAGLGATSRFLCNGRERSWTCLEPDPGLHRQLESSLGVKPLASPGRALLGTVPSLPSEDRFDTILYIDVLEHIEDDRAELTGSAAHLRPGGHVVVLAPAHQGLYSPFDKAVGHYRRYSKRSLLAAAPATLRPVAAYYLDAVGMVASLANRWLLRAFMPTYDQLMFWDRVLVPASRVIDPILAHRLGKSVVAVWTTVLPRPRKESKPAQT